MTADTAVSDLLSRLDAYPRAQLALLPTPIQRLKHFGSAVGVSGLWMKRDDLTGLEGGGNKTRKLEYLVGDALASKANMLATIGAIQSNHTRQTAAAAAKIGLKCALLHCAWTKDASPQYREVGNILISHVVGADLYVDEQVRPIEDQSPLADFVAQLESEGHKPYSIPGGGSEHPLGCFGYIRCAAEIAAQSEDSGIHFDYLIHCTGSSSTQAGLLAGFAALGLKTRVIGVSDDGETDIKEARVLELANNALQKLDIAARVAADDVEVIACNANDYGVPDAEVIHGIRLLASKEGLVADPVYEGRAIRGLMNMIDDDELDKDASILLMHLGGSPAMHAYAGHFGPVKLGRFEA